MEEEPEKLIPAHCAREVTEGRDSFLGLEEA